MGVQTGSSPLGTNEPWDSPELKAGGAEEWGCRVLPYCMVCHMEPCAWKQAEEAATCVQPPGRCVLGLPTSSMLWVLLLFPVAAAVLDCGRALRATQCCFDLCACSSPHQPCGHESTAGGGCETCLGALDAPCSFCSPGDSVLPAISHGWAV